MTGDRGGGDAVRPKTKYHHGDLKEALVQAAYDLISRQGAENFSLADACRLAGVSTAAPYKHFRDRDELLEMVVVRAFDALAARSMAAVAAVGPGTLAGIIAMGEAYVGFAVDEQRLFRLAFGQHPALKRTSQVMCHGEQCFGGVIEQVALYCRLNGVAGDPRAIAIRLWTFVHGAAALVIDEDYAVVAPDLDVAAMIRDTTPMLLPPSRPDHAERA
jgi:AcrR family transcriptional regulator